MSVSKQTASLCTLTTDNNSQLHLLAFKLYTQISCEISHWSLTDAECD